MKLLRTVRTKAAGQRITFYLIPVPKGREKNKLSFLLGVFWSLASLKSLANTTVLPTFFASPATKIH
ncbi:MAG: hypothetical protein ACI81P_000721, partial [Neolewinella sp.]